eukprot:351093-Chlamydomonas_euryale.AAC.2
MAPAWPVFLPPKPTTSTHACTAQVVASPPVALIPALRDAALISSLSKNERLEAPDAVAARGPGAAVWHSIAAGGARGAAAAVPADSARCCCCRCCCCCGGASSPRAAAVADRHSCNASRKERWDSASSNAAAAAPLLSSLHAMPGAGCAST